MMLIQILAQTPNDANAVAAEAAQTLDEKAMGYLETYGVPALVALVLLFASFILASWVGSMVRRSCQRAKLELTLARFFGKIASWAVLVMAILSILNYFGVQTTSFAAVIGASALAIGLAFQGTLSSFAAGIMLLIFRPFKVDDVIKVAGETGKVFEIDLFTTVMDTFDNRRIIVPNSSVFGSTIENITFHPTRRVDVNVGTDYGADLDEVRRVLHEAVGSIDKVHADPEPVVYLLEMGDSSINWVVRVWTDTPEFWAVREALTCAIKQHLDEAKITIPFPQMDVHLDPPASA